MYCIYAVYFICRHLSNQSGSPPPLQAARTPEAFLKIILIVFQRKWKKDAKDRKGRDAIFSYRQYMEFGFNIEIGRDTANEKSGI